jgi:hypothetical protein
MILLVRIPLAEESDPEEGTDCSADELQDHGRGAKIGVLSIPCFSPMAPRCLFKAVRAVWTVTKRAT